MKISKFFAAAVLSLTALTSLTAHATDLNLGKQQFYCFLRPINQGGTVFFTDNLLTLGQTHIQVIEQKLETWGDVAKIAAEAAGIGGLLNESINDGAVINKKADGTTEIYWENKVGGMERPRNLVLDKDGQPKALGFVSAEGKMYTCENLQPN